MATALAKGFVRSGLTQADAILASDPSENSRAVFAREVGAKTIDDNTQVPQFASVVVLAVKPHHASAVLAETQSYLSGRHLFISIAAGLTLDRLARIVPEGPRLVRVMPNTPALIGASATAYALGRGASTSDALFVQKLFSAVGMVLQVDESLLDAVTGLSGSGPAFGYVILEALSDGGVAAGLPRDAAIKLAAQTMLGAARMVLETGQHPGALKDMVTSPGGTAIEGIHELEKGHLRATLISAVRAAAEKSRRLSQG